MRIFRGVDIQGERFCRLGGDGANGAGIAGGAGEGGSKGGSQVGGTGALHVGVSRYVERRDQSQVVATRT